ncbi:RICIN domain-containing protein, partial [Polymorphospora rubra]
MTTRPRRRTATILAATVATTLLGGLLAAVSAQAAAPVNSGVYTLASASSGKCVQVAGAATGNGVLLTQVACDGGAGHQQFR